MSTALRTRRTIAIPSLLVPDADRPGDEPFDLWLRYLHAARIVDRLCQGVAEPVRILDVGCNVVDRLGKLFDPQRVQVVRCDRLEGPEGDTNYIQLPNDGPLPFDDRFFDAVVALEVLEHVPRPVRREFIADLVRVARRGVVLSCPDGTPEVLSAEQVVSEAYRLRHGEAHPFLREHAEFGLPNEEEVRSLLDELDLQYAVMPGLGVDQWLAATVLTEGLLERGAAGPLQAEVTREFSRRPSDATPYRKYYVIAKVFDAAEALDPAVIGSPSPGFAGEGLGVRAPQSPTNGSLPRPVTPPIPSPPSPLPQRRERGADRLAAAVNHCSETAAAVMTQLHFDQGHLPSALRAVIREQENGLKLQELRFRINVAFADALTQSMAWKLLTPLRVMRHWLRPRGFDQTHLLPWQDIEPVQDSPLNTWQALSDDPQFLVSCWLPAGWLRVRLKCHSTVKSRIEFYAERLGGFDTASLLGEVSLTSGDNDEEFFLKLEQPTRALRIDPLNVKGRLHIERLEVAPRPGPCTIVDALRRKLRLLRAYHNTGPVLLRGLKLLCTGQWGEVGKKWALGLHDPRCTRHGFYEPEKAYEKWIEKHKLADADRAGQRAWSNDRGMRPTISLLLPTYNTPERFLRLAIESVLRQTYPHWELCIADDGSTEPHVRTILEEYAAKEPRMKLAPPGRHGGISAATNAALTLATGEFIGLFDHDDELAEQALYAMARHAVEQPGADVIYSDEDKIQPDGKRVTPFFKPDWSPEFFLGCMYTCHLSLYRTSIVREVGGFRAEFDGAQDYDLALRVIEKARRIEHVPDVLYHWRLVPGSTACGVAAKPHAQAAALRALEQHMHRTGRPARAEVGPSAGLNFVRPTIRGTPTISIIIPSLCKTDPAPDRPTGFLENCVASIRRKSSWRYFEVIVLDRHTMSAPLERRLVGGNIRRVTYDEPFNWSAVNNLGARQATGEYLLFLNDDVEVQNAAWLEAMLEFAQQPEIGAVGAKLLFPDGGLQHVGVTVLDGRPGHPFYGYPKQHPGYYCRNLLPHNCAAVTGACLMTRADVFREVGGFDETFPLNYNDVDYCFRLRQKGYRVVYTPHAELMHFESVTKAGVFAEELHRFQARWGTKATDPYYNPNLNTETFDYRIG